MTNAKRPWRSNFRHKFSEEVERINQLPLNQKNSPLLVGTAMGRSGNFELAWNMDRNILFVWATSGTWEYVLTKIVKCDRTGNNCYVNSSKKHDFLDKIKQKSGKSYLRSYVSSYCENLLKRSKPWLNAPMKDGLFGKWVELAYLLPSYIPLRFGPNFEIANNRNTSLLKNVQDYANIARSFFACQGELIGYGVGDSGLWLDANPIHRPNLSFRLIWGLGGRSDFVFRLNDGSAEFWDLKTRPPSKSISNIQELVSLNSVKQVLQQAPMQVIYPLSIGILKVLPVKRVGVLGIGVNDKKKVTCHHEILDNPFQGEPQEKLFGQNSSVLERSISTVRLVQWVEKLNNRERVELAAQVLREAIYSFTDALVISDEWDAILCALDKYGFRKYGSNFPAPRIV